MSADCWRKCPKCLRKAKDERHKAAETAQAKYGKISESEYRNLIAKAQEPIVLPDTLREDYCQRIDEDGEYEVEYYARCASCLFEFQYKHTETALK